MKKKTGNFLIYKKINIVLILIVLLLFVTIGIPSFCMLLMNNNDDSINYWNGLAADNFAGGDGTIDNPYLIGNGEEFAFFKEQINNGNNYANTYFKFTDNIHLNKGVIEYNGDDIIYIYDSKKYYVKPYTNEYYGDIELTELIGTINRFDTIGEFKGNIDGNNKFIYGLYLTDSVMDNVSLFDSISGNINNLYFSNLLIYGKYNVGLIKDAINLKYNNLIFNGNIYSSGEDKIESYSIDDFEMVENSKTIYLDKIELSELSKVSSIILRGNLLGDSIYINDNYVDTYEFEIELDDFLEQLVIRTDTIGDKISNLTYEVKYNNSVSSLIINSNNSEVINTIIRGSIINSNIASSLMGVVTNSASVRNTFNNATILGNNISAGLIGITNKSTLNISNVYNDGSINSNNISGGLIGYVSDNSYININHSFNVGDINGLVNGAIIGQSDILVSNNNNYFINNDLNSVGNDDFVIGEFINKETLLTEKMLKEDLGFQESIWLVDDGNLPRLMSFDNNAPLVTIKLLDYEWNDYNDDSLKVTESSFLIVDCFDNESDILKIEYFIGNRLYSLSEIDDLSFQLYEDNIILDENGQYYIIFKATDVVGNIKIVTTDLITVEGYNLVISDIYNNSLSEYNNQISTNSLIKYKYTRTYPMDEYIYDLETKYMLESSTEIPDGTSIKIVDNINEVIYVYNVDNKDLVIDNNNYFYDLSLFNQIGQDSYFDNKVWNYYQNNMIKEDFDIVFDFKKVDIDKNYEFKINLINIYDLNIVTTTYTNVNNSFILARYDDNNNEIDYTYKISTDYNSYLELNKVSEYNINLVNSITYSKLNNKNIYDSRMFNDEKYLLFKILDDRENVVLGNLINNLVVSYDGIEYYSNRDGYIKVPFTNDNINLTLNTYYNINDIVNGTYYLKISSCNSFKCSVDETIPINILNEISNVDCNYFIDIDNLDRLINKKSGITANNDSSMDIRVNYNCNLISPNIRVKLYRKLNFDSDNQVYELIDLSEYIYNNLEKVNDYEYYFVKELFDNNINNDLDLIINNYQYGGYKLIFELYDGNTLIGEDSKTFIVK